MPQFRHSTIIDQRTMATEVFEKDLPVNPLSHLAITIEAFNTADEATITEILSFINRVTVTHKGVNVYNGESEDLAALNAYLFGSGGQNMAPTATDNAYIAFTLIVPFGRMLYNPEECFPATKRGEFQLQMDTTVPSASLDNATITVTAVELPGANPTNFLKTTLLTISAPGATGDHDIDLPIGNVIPAILVGMTSFPAVSSKAFTINALRLLVDNVEKQMVSAKTSALMGEMMARMPASVRQTAAQGDTIPKGYTWLDFDPVSDDSSSIVTQGASSVQLRAVYGIDEEVFISPLEIVPVSALAV